MSASREKQNRQNQAANGWVAPKTAREAQQRKEEQKTALLYGTIGLVFLGVVIASFIWNSNIIHRNATAATIDGEKYTASQVSFYYRNAYAGFVNQWSYLLGYLGLTTSSPLEEQFLTEDTATMLDAEPGISWREYFMDTALNQMASVQSALKQANEENYVFPDSVQTEYQENLDSLSTAARSIGTSVGKYLQNMYGNAMTERVYRTELMRMIQYQAYCEAYEDGLTYTDEEIDEAYAADPNSYDLVSYEAAVVDGSVPQPTEEETAPVESTEETVSEETAPAEGTEEAAPVEGTEEAATEEAAPAEGTEETASEETAPAEGTEEAVPAAGTEEAAPVESSEEPAGAAGTAEEAAPAVTAGETVEFTSLHAAAPEETPEASEEAGEPLVIAPAPDAAPEESAAEEVEEIAPAPEPESAEDAAAEPTADEEPAAPADEEPSADVEPAAPADDDTAASGDAGEAEEPAESTQTPEEAAALAEARQTAETLLAAYSRGESLETAAGQAERTSYRENASASYDGTALSDWLFDSARTSGESGIIESGSTIYVVVFRDRYRDENKTVNVRHLLVTPEEGTLEAGAEGYDEEQQALMDAAKAKAEDLYAQWQAGEATEDSFAALVTEETDDTGSKETGGLYSQIAATDSYVQSFLDWCFDPDRTSGDTGIIESTYGYHIMYFVGDDIPVWKKQVTDNLRTTDYNEWMESLTADVEIVPNQLGLRFI